MSGARAVFVDRDGVINDLVVDPQTGRPESPLRGADVRLMRGAAPALRQLAERGWRVVGVSNQPSAAKGLIPLEQLQRVQARVLELLAAEGVALGDFRLCLHHPEGVIAGLDVSCDCRKPAPGMLLAAARDLDLDLEASWMVGDTDSDVAAGRAAGCRTVLIDHPGSHHKRNASVAADTVVADLAAAASFILAAERVGVRT